MWILDQLDCCSNFFFSASFIGSNSLSSGREFFLLKREVVRSDKGLKKETGTLSLETK